MLVIKVDTRGPFNFLKTKVNKYSKIGFLLKSNHIITISATTILYSYLQPLSQPKMKADNYVIRFLNSSIMLCPDFTNKTTLIV